MFKTSLINNRPHNRLSNILWTAYSKLMDRTTYMVYFQQSTTASSNITVFIIIIPHLHHQLINNKLQGSVQDYLKDIFTTTNHSLLQHLTKKSHSWKVIFIVSLIKNQPQLLPIPYVTINITRERDWRKISLEWSLSTI